MTQSLRWGILGTGMIAAKFAADLKYTSQGVLVASGSRRQQTADSFAVKHGGRGIAGYEALINDPDLIVLDEPTSGLDPLGCNEVKKLIRVLAERGKTVILCSHLLADVEDVCDNIYVMYGGKIRVSGDLDNLLTVEDKTRFCGHDFSRLRRTASK